MQKYYYGNNPLIYDIFTNARLKTEFLDDDGDNLLSSELNLMFYNNIYGFACFSLAPSGFTNLGPGVTRMIGPRPTMIRQPAPPPPYPSHPPPPYPRQVM